MLCFHRSRPSTASRIRHRGLIVLVFGAKTIFRKDCTQDLIAGHRRSPPVTVGGRMTHWGLPATKNRLRVAGHPRSAQVAGYGGRRRLTWPATADQAKTTGGQQDLRRRLYSVTAGHPRPPQATAGRPRVDPTRNFWGIYSCQI